MRSACNEGRPSLRTDSSIVCSFLGSFLAVQFAEEQQGKCQHYRQKYDKLILLVVALYAAPAAF